MDIDEQIDFRAEEVSDDDMKHISSGQVTTKLRSAIRTGILESGYRLKELALASQYQVKRSAVREALTVLEAEGLIQRHPSKGFEVFVVTLADAQDIYEAREVLEGLASRLFAERASADQIRELKHAIDQFAFEANKYPIQQDKLLEKKNMVYDVLLRGCENNIVYNLLQSLRDRISYLRRQTLSYAGRPEHTLKELRNIFDAIVERDEKKAEEASILHVRNAAKVAYAELKRREKTQRIYKV